jgi:hypothetical protein
MCSCRPEEGPTNGLFTSGATLELAGVERFPVTADGDDSTNELIQLLSS